MEEGWRKRGSIALFVKVHLYLVFKSYVLTWPRYSSVKKLISLQNALKIPSKHVAVEDLPPPPIIYMFCQIFANLYTFCQIFANTRSCKSLTDIALQLLIHRFMSSIKQYHSSKNIMYITRNMSVKRFYIITMFHFI